MIPYLREALRLAESRKGFTAPNPAVGAVLVRDGKLIGKGFHWAAGYPHAEVEAIRSAQDVEGATLYVTLEPCCHFGKTPPCTDLIIEKKIKEVVFGFPDPNPKVAGRGAHLLKEAGVKVRHENVPECNHFYRQYAYWTVTGKAWLTGKLALTDDLKTASLEKPRLKITGMSADHYTHSRRKEADVVMTSQATVKSDDPSLNVRVGDAVLRKPVWILDRKLEFSLDSKVLQTAQSVSLVFAKSRNNERTSDLSSRGISLIPISETNGALDVERLAQELGNRGFHEAWLEFGQHFFLSFLKAKQFQEIVLYISNRKYETGKGPGPGFFKEFTTYEKISEEQMGADRKEIWMLKTLTEPER